MDGKRLICVGCPTMAQGGKAAQGLGQRNWKTDG